MKIKNFFPVPALVKALVFLLAFFVALPANAAGLPATVAAALKEAGIPPDHAGLFVQDVSGSQPLLASGELRSMNPASTIKLLTTYAALEMLGPAYTWKTEIYGSGEIRNEVLNGDLIIRGYGDPTLALENFWLLLRDLRGRGIREIRGDLVLDNRYFRVTNGDPGAFDNEPYRPYNVGPEALLVNFKTIRFRFIPEPEQGAVRIVADPALASLQIINRLWLANGVCGKWRDAVTTDVRQDAGVVTVSFGGGYSADCGEKELHLSLFDNTRYVHGIFRALWEGMGGTLHGGVRVADLPSDAKLQASRESKPLAEVVRDINKFSNNLMARQLFLTLGAEFAAQPGAVKNAEQAIEHWLYSKGLDFPELVLENGSGLSRIERISPRHLGELLLAAYRSPVLAELESSLPVVAVDGTMQKRLKENGVAGHAHIKSGTLEGVLAIAGYVLDEKGRRMVVVCVINHPNAAAGKPVQDALLEWVYRRR